MDFQLNISPHLGRVIHIIEPQLLADQFQKGCNLYFFRQRNSQFQFLFAFRNYRFRRFWGGLDFGFGCGGPACLGQHGLQFGDLLFLPGQLFFQPGQQRRRSRFRFCCGGLCSRCWLSGWCRFDGRFGLFFFGLLPCCTLAKGLNDFCKGLLLIRFSRGGLFFGLNLFLNLLSFLLSRDEGLHQFFTEKVLLLRFAGSRLCRRLQLVGLLSRGHKGNRCRGRRLIGLDCCRFLFLGRHCCRLRSRCLIRLLRLNCGGRRLRLIF